MSPSLILNILQHSTKATAIYTSIDLHIGFASEEMCRFWGKGSDVVGKTFLEILPELKDQEFPGHLRRVWEEGSTHRDEEALAKLEINGVLGFYYFDYEYRAITDEQGQTYAIIHTAEDVTRRVVDKRKFEELSQREKQLASDVLEANAGLVAANEELVQINKELGQSQIVLNETNLHLREKDYELQFAINAAELGTWDLDPVTNKFTGNDRLKFWFGLKADDAIELYHAVDVMLEEDRDRVSAAIRHAMEYASGGFYDIEYTIMNPVTKIPRVVRAKGRALFNSSREATRFSGILQDITEERKATEALQEVNDRLAIALEAGKFGTYDLDMATGLMICSPQCKQNYGLPPSATFNFPDLLNVIKPEHQNVVMERVNEAVSQRKTYTAEYQVRWPDGTMHWVSVAGSPRYNADGSPARMIGVSMNITDAMHARIEREQLTDRLQEAIELGTLGLWSAEIETGEMTLSQHGRAMHGLARRQSVTLEYLMTLVDAEFREAVRQTFQQALKSNKPFEITYLVNPPDGTKPRWLKASGKSYLNEEGKAVSISGIMRDITEQREDELRKNDFIGMVSHELKTPLTTIKGYTQLLQGNPELQDIAFAKNAVTKMLNQINKMSTLITGFLDISRLESGKIQLDYKPVNVRELVAEVIDETTLLMQNRIRFNSCEDLVIQADADKVAQVLTNFLSNAAKYSAPDQEIVVACAVKGTELQISVKDSGIGITAEDKEKLFERYSRIESLRTRNIAGFGIGLYICSEVIKRHGGRIWVDSVPGEGSTFFFTLPIAPKNTDAA